MSERVEYTYIGQESDIQKGWSFDRGEMKEITQPFVTKMKRYQYADRGKSLLTNLNRKETL